MSALDAQLQREDVRTVIVVAPPKALATLREAVTPLVKNVLRGEIAKDLVNEPVEKIAAHLQG
jgi:protein required for attachment to host cells